MLSYLSGTLIDKEDQAIIVDVHGCGFRIFVTQDYLQKLEVEKQMIQIDVYLHVREDALTLYGFGQRIEKDVFLKLMSVKGIGAKAAMNILSSLSYDVLIHSILTNNIQNLMQAQGVGRKTAERIVLELRDKFNDVNITELAIGKPSECAEEAVEALVALGFSKHLAYHTIKEIDHKNLSTEEILKFALQKLHMK